MFDIYGPPTHAYTTKNEPISMYVGDAQLSNHFFFYSEIRWNIVFQTSNFNTYEFYFFFVFLDLKYSFAVVICTIFRLILKNIHFLFMKKCIKIDKSQKSLKIVKFFLITCLPVRIHHVFCWDWFTFMHLCLNSSFCSPIDGTKLI